MVSPWSIVDFPVHTRTADVTDPIAPHTGSREARRPSKNGAGAKAARQERRQEEGKRAAEGEGSSAAPAERHDGWIGPGGKPVPGETVKMSSSAAHQRVGQMRDGKRARPE